ncbi:MAG: hypothetical protein A2033_19560 [Bacteroidetes bacterium GWA2_31_9]|nr:MAG: hypothetical protein A2033_19560 [Bacteroidetes bacterium GWA2_31_9]
MNLVVDTNIVFSTLLNPNSTIGELLMNVQDKFTFFAPELLIEEIERYSDKIELYSKLNKKELKNIKLLILNTIEFVTEDLISKESWEKAFKLTKDIDEFDTPFIALSIELSTKLWTGDKKLIKGLISHNSELIISTDELKKYLIFH